MDPPPSAFENTHYTECDVFPIDGVTEYAVFYENKGENSCGLGRMTEAQIIDEIRVGRNLVHESKETVERMEKQELRIVYMDSAGSMVLHDIQQKMETDDIFLFTDVRALDFNTWNMFARDNFSVIHMPCFKKGTNCSGYGGITILYRKSLKVVNHGRIFTWKLLNTEKGKIFPGVEGVFVDVTNESPQKVNRICTMFHWKHENTKGFDPMVNVTNFTSHFLTKPIPPRDDAPIVVHIFGRFNYPSEKFLPFLRDKHPELQLIPLDHPDVYILSTNPSLFTSVSNDPHEIFSFVVKLVS